MRYLAWIAVFSLQLGIFVCEAGVDVCHDTNSIQCSLSSSDDDHASVPSESCVAHAAHAFLGYIVFQYDEPDLELVPMGLFTSLATSEVFLLIEQPPKQMRS